jgi:1,4-dihydroxy-6-naphthoate synthase
LTDVFYRSVKYAIENEDEALKYAMTYGRDLTLEEARKFVRMYVNQDTLDMGEEGYKAIVTLFTLGKEKGIISSIPEIDLIFPH